jgi:xanthine dehydrogenase molybdenum-binding subunit
VDGKTPAISESPLVENIETYFADTYEPSGPFGAKGIGEAATNPCAAAYANALYNALGIRFRELPITQEKILSALRAQDNTQRQSETLAPSSIKQNVGVMQPAE